MLALWYAAPRVGLNNLKAAVNMGDTEISTAPAAHPSFLYWNAFLIAGCPEVWDIFAFTKNNEGGSIRSAMKEVKAEVTPEQWEKMCRVLGFAEPARLKQFSPRKTSSTVWTRGGVWDKRNGFTRIILFKQHLPRSYAFNTWTWKLGEKGAALLEAEVHHNVNPELLLYPVCLRKATEAVRMRLPQILGYVNMKAGYEITSWFFQAWVYNEKGYGYTYRYPERKPRLRTTKEGHAITWGWP